MVLSVSVFAEFTFDTSTLDLITETFENQVISSKKGASSELNKELSTILNSNSIPLFTALLAF